MINLNSSKIYYVGIGVMLLVMLNTFMTPIDDEANLSYRSGTFQSITRQESRGHSISYDLYLNEYSTYFKISASYVNCFDYAKFERFIAFGDSLTIGVSKNGRLEKESIAYLHSKRHSYFNLDCRNELLLGNKNSGLIIGAIILVVLGLLTFRKTRKDRRIN